MFEYKHFKTNEVKNTLNFIGALNMEINKFIEYGIHFDNFSGEQLTDLLDFDGIEELPDCPERRLAVEALGQYLVGNRTDPAKTFLGLTDTIDRKDFVDTWFSAIKDPHTLQGMGCYVANRLLEASKKWGGA